jgi:hypothetical protein
MLLDLLLSLATYTQFSIGRDRIMRLQTNEMIHTYVSSMKLRGIVKHCKFLNCIVRNEHFQRSQLISQIIYLLLSLGHLQTFIIIH